MRNRIILFSLLLLCLLGLTTGGYPQDEDMSMYIEPTFPPDFPKPGDTAISEKTVNGITVRIIDVKQSIVEREQWTVPFGESTPVKKKVLTIDVCYSTPDAGEWYLFGGEEMVGFGSERIGQSNSMPNWQEERLADGSEMGEKCERYFFDFDPDVEINPPLTITFTEAFAIPREHYQPCEEIRERFATNGRAVAAGLVIGCNETPNGNPPGIDFPFESTVRLDRFDETVLTKQEAHVLMLEIESGRIYGPWEFTIESIGEE